MSAAARRAADAAAAPYRLRWATGAEDLRRAQALRFEVFNVELRQGLSQSWSHLLDEDPFDAVCSHLLVEDTAGEVVGTYRMQTGLQASRHLGYYAEQAFDFTPFESFRAQILELGRACIAANHRNFTVLNLLWRGIAAHAKTQGCRYLMGCSSLAGCDPAVGAAAWARLRSSNLAPDAWRTEPRAPHGCPLNDAAPSAPPLPRLLAAYLALGAAVCCPPALDLAFGTIDFLTWLDLQTPRLQHLQARGRFLPFQV
jgi:putative hemolysin